MKQSLLFDRYLSSAAYDNKSFIHLTIIVLSLIGSNGVEAEFQNNHTLLLNLAPKKLIIDTDAGSDDGLAILNILAAENLYGKVVVELITAVRGNTHVDNVATNVLKILKTADRLDIPLYKGANQSLIQTPAIENFFGEDGFGDFPFDDPPSKDFIKNEHAVNALIKAANSNPGQLTLVCLGPLTNIALAVKLESNFFKNLKEIYILGGSDSGVGNISPGVEFNFFIDPEAAFILLKEAEKKEKILHLVPWETAFVRSTVDMEWRKEVLGVIKNSQIDLINKAERLTLNGDTWVSSDTILSSLVIDSSIITASDIYHADVEVWGQHSRAALFVDYAFSTNFTKNVHIIKSINVNQFKSMLLQNFNLQNRPTNEATTIGKIGLN